jgi:DNA-binding CsgD family transcriptional regulator
MIAQQFMESMPESTQPSPAPRQTGRPPTAFVGRGRELALVRDRLSAASQGEGGIVFLSGEPGIGKSRLLDEAATLAQSNGWRVLKGYAYDSEGMPPYLPFIEALQDYVRLCPLNELSEQLGVGAAEAALLLPEARRRLPNLPVAEPVTPEGGRYRLFESVSNFLQAIARAAPTGLLLCLDDLQWADDSTLLLLEHIVRRSSDAPLMILASYRSTDLDLARPLARSLERLTQRRVSQRLDLKRLGKETVSAMLAALGRPDPPSSLVDAVYGETEGNPFFVREVFDYLRDEGRLFDAGGGWRAHVAVAEADVPQSVRLVIGRRLQRLSAACQETLPVAAVLGRTFSYELLRTLTEPPGGSAPALTEDALIEALEEAEKAQLLVSGADGQVTFAHELIRQTLLGTLSARRRQLLHQRAADALVAASTDNPDVHLPELVYHLSQAGASYSDKAAASAFRAGDQASAVFAYEEAARLYQMALDFESRRAIQDQQSRLSELHLKLGLAYQRMQRQVDAQTELKLALDLLPPQNECLRSEILARLAWIYTSSPYAASPEDRDLLEAKRCAAEALVLAEALGDDALAGDAMAALGFAEAQSGNLTQALEYYGLALARSGAFTLEFASHPLHLYWAGRIEEAAERARKSADILQGPGQRCARLAVLGMALAANGRYDEAEAAFSESRSLARPLATGLLPRATSMSTGYHLDLFDLAGAKVLATAAREEGREAGYGASIGSAGIDLLLSAIRSQDLAEARTILQEVTDDVAAVVTGPHPWLFFMRLALARSELCLAEADWPAALSFAEVALERSRSSGRPKYEALGLAARGNALLGLGRKVEALVDLLAAVDVARPVGDPALFLGIASNLLAVAEDNALAAEAQAAVHRILSGLSNVEMRRAFQDAEPVRRVLRLAESAAMGAPKARSIYPDNLTEREVDVLRLIVKGKSSREIAADLILSVRTVERHISNVYLKTDSHGRAQATAYAIAHGLT